MLNNDINFIRNIANEIVTRKRSVDFYSSNMFLPDPDYILRREGKDVSVYKELLCDPHVWACVQSRKSGVLSMEWEINRGRDKTEQSKVIENIFKSLDMYTIISSILNAPLFGFQPLEIIWQKKGDLVIPVDIKAKPQEWFCFDDDNKLKFRTKENYYGEDLPLNKFLCPQSNPSYQNPYGERALSRVLWPVSFKRGGMRFWVKFLEKYGMPFLVGKYPRGLANEEIEKMADILDSMVQDAISVIPNDSQIEVMEARNASSGEAYEKLIDKMNAEISKAILGQTLTTEIGFRGSYAASNTHMNVRKDIIDADKKLVERTLNQLIQWIYEINFNSSDIPTFKMYEEEDVDLELSQRDKILSEAGVRFTKEYFKKAYGLDDEDFEIQQEPPKKNPTVFRAFNQTENNFSDQEAINHFMTSFSNDELQVQAENILGPIFQIIGNCTSYDEMRKKLSESGFNTDETEEILQKIIFVSEIWGKLNGNY